MSTLVFVEHQDGKVKNASLELLTACQKAGKAFSAIVFGKGSDGTVETLGKYGCTKAFIQGASDFENYNSELFTDITAQAIKDSGATLVLASGSLVTKDLLPRTAARTGASYTSDCVTLNLGADDLGVRKPLYAGKCSAQVKLQNTDTYIVVMRPNQLSVEDGTQGGTPETTSLTVSTTDLKTVIKEVVKGASEKLDLTEANIIVSGGRGLKEAANFKMLEDLADTIGATVGASRAVVDAGWVPHGMQVGQTGKTVAPSLYIAVGISGAIQHLAGMSSSKVIVAINKDPEAPIFKKATYGIVGDAFEVVPKLTEEFKKVLNA